jgi:hypothetical protein
MTTCRFFNQAGGCRNGDHCRYQHISKRVKLLPICAIFQHGQKCPNFKTCKNRHHALEHELPAIREARKFAQKERQKGRIIKSEEEKFTATCGRNKHWRDDVLAIHSAMEFIVPNDILQLIGEYHISDINLIKWSHLTYTLDGFHPDYLDISGKYDLKKCSHCDRKCNDMWVVIYPLIVFGGDRTHFRYQKCCGNCLRFDFETNGGDYCNSQPIMVSEKWKPVIDWNASINVRCKNNKVVPANDRTRLSMFGITQLCWVIPGCTFNEAFLYNEHGGSLKKLLDYTHVPGENLLYSYFWLR